MAKDYAVPDKAYSYLMNAREFYLDCGDAPDRAEAKAWKLCKDRFWMLAPLERHAKHGRCGGNADEALADLRAGLAEIGMAGVLP